MCVSSGCEIARACVLARSLWALRRSPHTQGKGEGRNLRALQQMQCAREGVVWVWAPLFPSPPLPSLSLSLSLLRFILCPPPVRPLRLHASDQPTRMHTLRARERRGGEREQSRFCIAHLPHSLIFPRPVALLASKLQACTPLPLPSFRLTLDPNRPPHRRNLIPTLSTRAAHTHTPPRPSFSPLPRPLPRRDAPVSQSGWLCKLAR